MKFTNNELLKIKEMISAVKIPIYVNNSNFENIELIFKNDPEVYLSLTKTDEYKYSGTRCDGKPTSFENIEFNNFLYYIRNWLTHVRKENPNIVEHNPLVKQFSPKFYSIFQEAILIDCLDFKESSGMIYRKALEIIIKDFLLSFLPHHEEIIMNETIGGIVYFFYEVESDLLLTRSSRKYKGANVDLTSDFQQLSEILPFVNFVNKTFKIGNDFSHYERKLEKYSSKDLEENILQILEYIETKYTVIEGQKKLMQIDSKFNRFSL